MIYGKGISRIGEIVDLATDLDIIHKSGAWFSYEGNKIGQGRENTKAFLEEHKDIRDEIEKKILGNREAVVLATKNARKEAELSAAASSAASQNSGNAGMSVVVDADEDFEEFTPVTEE